MKHTATGFWLEEAGAVEAVPALDGDVDADVVVLGGGYTGMWTAWQLLRREPEARVVLLEAGVCGHGPSGRNGGFAETLWTNLPDLVDRFGTERALAAAEASSASVEAIGAWCEAEGVDAWFRPAGFLLVSARRGAGRRAGPADRDRPAAGVIDAGNGSGPRSIALDRDEVAERCDSPAFRRAVFAPDDATVQPARLALGLRAAAARARRARSSSTRACAGCAWRRDVVAETAGGRVRARRGRARAQRRHARRAAAALAARRRPRRTSCSPSRCRTCSSDIGWTGGESITDGRTFVHYFRTTPDGRVAFGWGGGPLAFGARLNGRVERSPATATRRRAHLRDLPGARRAQADARVGRADRRVPEPPAAGRHAVRRAGALRVRLHRQRRRPVAPGGADPRRAGARRARRGDAAGARRPVAADGAARAARVGGRLARARGVPAAGADGGGGAAAGPAHPRGHAAPKALGIHVGR